MSRRVPAPAGFDTPARELWLSVQRHLRRQGTWEDADAPLLEAYVRCVTIARQARAEADREPFVEGSKGQPVAHPGLKVASEAERDACRYASALLLTPEARRRHDLAPTTDAPSDFVFDVIG